ncbi:hypothetical protein BK004_02035 [bacterium CG10_46_32]|nr:MAG: hypothetical protein BK004_02035 [bacterium CG10_46_32]PIR56213.1 MAG: hypothetical protein COU73_02060 [Parcubacteria group bacterium CG10_big_fil_rev_8_21_14_0_10_46_32]
MEQSFLILGSNPSISFAEIFQFLGRNQAILPLCGPNAVIVDDALLGKSAPLFLGGIPKSGAIIKDGAGFNASSLAVILETYIVPNQKFHFGLSWYTISGQGLSRERLKALGLEIKKILKQKGVSVRLVESGSGNLSSVDVVKNKLLDKGVELCIFAANGKYLIGKTQAVQPFEAYSERDYGRPGRNAAAGMLPPKLARAMINLSGVPKESLILDPFCGVGTVLQEALLLGHRAIGTDIDEGAIRDTKKNIEWLIAEQNKELTLPRIEMADVRTLDQSIEKESIDAIVAEVDLGPPLQGDESEAKVLSIERSLSAFYADALASMGSVLKPKGRAVIAWPYFKEHGLFVSAFDSLADLGWKFVEPYPSQFQTAYPLSKRGTLRYGREGQHVFREILILEKK